MLTQTTNLRWGTTLVQHYADNESPDKAGSVSFYQALEDQLRDQSMEYYDYGGKNKFFTKVTLNVYSKAADVDNPYPDHGAVTVNIGDGTSIIYSRFWDPADGYDSYSMPAIISHEFGHAYHNWCRLYYVQPIMQVWSPYFENLITNPDVRYQDGVSPWGHDQKPWERFADAFRALKGVYCTRGVSGDNREPVPSGFIVPTQIPGLKKQLDLLPETTAFMRNYNPEPNTLCWYGGETGWWEFYLAGKHFKIAQTDYDLWYYCNVNSDGSTGPWIHWDPAYTLA